MYKINIVGSVIWAEQDNDTKGTIVLTDDNFYIFPCPHCLSYIRVKASELNCRIFRHGNFKKNGKGINPHLNKEGCTDLVNKACIYGCAMPFTFVGGGLKHLDDTKCVVKACDYI